MAKKKPWPSQQRYNEKHPTVSIRVSPEFRDELRKLQVYGGKTLGDILREALGKQFPDAKKPYDKGYKEGYGAAKKKYEVTYMCRECFQRIPITGEEAKSAAATYMMRNGWGHEDCRVINQTGYSIGDIIIKRQPD